MSTQKIQIAVAIDAEGKWCAIGCGPGNVGRQEFARAMADAEDTLDSVTVTAEHLIEAELPIPESKTVRGTVRKAK